MLALKKIRKFLLYPYYKLWIFRLKKNICLAEDEVGVICPFGIGDTYIVCALAHEILKTHNVKVVPLVKKTHSSIPGLFSSIVRFEVLDCASINVWSLTVPQRITKGSIIIGHPYFLYNSHYTKLLGFKDLNLADVYKLIFDLSSKSELEQPVFKSAFSSDARDKFKKYNFLIEKTIILAPDVNSADKLPVIFWEMLAQKLKQTNFVVCTNITKNESAVKGTFPIELSLNEIIGFAESGGCVVSIRSGLCELLSTTKCNLSVVYPDQKWQSGTFFSACSLKFMGLSHNLNEYVYKENEDMENLINNICNNILNR